MNDKSTGNNMMNSKFKAYLADFGLAKMMNSPNYRHAMPGVAGSYGYIAPGKFMGTRMNLSEKSDVYSYGVVLLEILKGRSAIESWGEDARDGLHIMEWVKKKMGRFEPAASVLDERLRGLTDQMVQEMVQTLGISLFCVNSSAATMKEVVALLAEVKSSPPEEWGGKTFQPLLKPPPSSSSFPEICDATKVKGSYLFS